MSSDDQRSTVTIAVTHNRPRPAAANLTEIAESIRVRRADLDQVLTRWSPEQLVSHLRTFTAEQLLPFAIRRQRGIN
jgi:hypothetical protein